MAKLQMYLKAHSRMLTYLFVGIGVVAALLVYRLAYLTGGVSAGELAVAHGPLGWHGIYQYPLDLPLKLLRSIVFAVFPDHGQLLTRLPNVFFGGLSILTFGWLMRSWHGTRPAVLASILFASSAWVLHASRLASFDVLYLWSTPTLLLINVQLHKHSTRPIIWYGSLLLWGLLLYIPGMVWLVMLSLYLQRQQILVGWKHFSQAWQRGLSVAITVIWLPLLVIDLTRSGQLVAWLGLPHHLAGPAMLAKQLAAVPAHLFIRGPQYPDMWLARLPILDAFSLVMCLIGIYFYVSRRQLGRGHLLGLFFVVGVILVGLGGPVSLSLLVPLLFIAAGTGIAYLLHGWLRVFPINPLARGIGVGLITVAVVSSCVYNLRAYFVAWPHNKTTQATFRYRL